MAPDYKKRLRKLRAQLIKKKLDSFLVTNETNVAYLSGFTGSDSLLLITADTQFFLTDSRYTEEARENLSGFTIVEVASSTYETIAGLVRKNRLKKIGFESMNVPFAVARRLGSYTGASKLKPAGDIVEKLRAVKDGEEIRLIEKSAALAKKVLKKAMAHITPAITEKDLSRMIECDFIKNGAASAFEAIVASGKNSSKPHAHPTDARIGKNNFVMLDIGCRLNNYNSDITRMALSGRVKNRFKEIYMIVKTAQARAIESIRPGCRIADLDAAGRIYIKRKGFGKFFGHSIGHGVGLDIHEEPSISERNNDVLMPGMVFTVEPAIYIPGFGGVRIEDMVLVTADGYRLLTR